VAMQIVRRCFPYGTLFGCEIVPIACPGKCGALDWEATRRLTALTNYGLPSAVGFSTISFESVVELEGRSASEFQRVSFTGN